MPMFDVIRASGNPPTGDNATNASRVQVDSTTGQFKWDDNGTVHTAVDNNGDTLTAPIIVTPVVTDATETVAATNVISAAESGKIFFLSAETEFLSTLPAPAAGLRFTFIVAAAPASASYTISSAGGTDNIHGQVVSAEDAAGSGDSTAGTAADLITIVADKAMVGDRVDIVSDGTLWYAIAYATVQDGITFTQT